MTNEWRRPDGSLDYQGYMDSPEWRKFREAYFKRHPDATCIRCRSISNNEHRQRFGTRLHLHHIHYATVGQEMDEDVEPVCKRCHDLEHSGGNIELPRISEDWRGWDTGPMEGFWDRALARIAKRRIEYQKTFDGDQLWKQLERLSRLEEYVHFCKGETNVRPAEGSGI